MHGLPRGYRTQKPIDFDDTAPATDGPGSWEWQPDVVPFAVDLARLRGVHRLVDIGCGSGRKLEPYADEFEIVGVDRPEIVDKLTPDGWWPLGFDLESGATLPTQATGTGAVLICSDVIEHMVNPAALLATLAAAIETAEALVLSTPERTLTRGVDHKGPPPNRHHAQEWSLGELVAYLEAHGLRVDDARLTRSNDHEDALATSLVVCR